MLKYLDEWAFVSPHDGLGGPPDQDVSCFRGTLKLIIMYTESPVLNQFNPIHKFESSLSYNQLQEREPFLRR
jgi:hypothetical protein